MRKIRLTGGEPLMREDIADLVGLLAEFDYVDDLALTTNGYLLPKFAMPLKQSGLSRISVSLDSLDDKVFKEMNGREYSVERVLSGIKAAEAAGFTQIKINAVVQRGINDHTLLDLVRYFLGYRAHRPVHRVYGCRKPERLEPRSCCACRRDNRTH